MSSQTSWADPREGWIRALGCGTGKIMEPHTPSLGLETDIHLDMTGGGSNFQQRHLMHRRLGTRATWRPICHSGILPISKLLKSFQQILGTTQEWIIPGSQCRRSSVVPSMGVSSLPPPIPAPVLNEAHLWPLVYRMSPICPGKAKPALQRMFQCQKDRWCSAGIWWSQEDNSGHKNVFIKESRVLSTGTLWGHSVYGHNYGAKSNVSTFGLQEHGLIPN